MALKRRGNEVTVFLVQNGVLAARAGASARHLQGLATEGIPLLADDFSLSERGIRQSELRAGVEPSTIAALVDLLVRQDSKAIWH
jgi:sulfur relay (sulfurtransferase) complex TusBCD TusD component (DsrE family)